MQNNSNIYIFVGQIVISMKKVLFCLAAVSVLFLLRNNSAQGKTNRILPQDGSRISVVVIDPGHGGKDPGAVVGKAREKDIVLDIALKLGNYIKTNFPDTKVIYTRSSDVFVPLFQRANIANKSKADLFISIHANYVNSKSVQGAETFVLGQHRSQDNLEVAKKENAVILLEEDYSTTYEGFDPNSPESYIMFELVQDEYLEQSVMLASSIQDQFRSEAKRYDRSVKQAGFLVLRQTTMPSVLVEAGFLSHQGERDYLLSEQGRTKIAFSIFNAFKDYKRKIEGKNSFSLRPENYQQKATVELAADMLSAPGSTYYSVQVAATQNPIEPIPANFKGEKNIFKLNSGATYKYYSGKFASHEDAVKEKKRLQNKFKDAFIVTLEAN
jgi:N-acetylmuramoyl-L-alanine amidase